MDDGSSDGSFALLGEYAKNNARIHVMKNEGVGIIDALQTAFSRATGEFITRMDADDVMPADKLETFHELAQKNPTSIVTGKVQYFSEGKISDAYLEYEIWLNNRIDANDHWR